MAFEPPPPSLAILRDPPRVSSLTAHRSIGVTFIAFGLAFGLWAGASGALLARTGVDDAEFGLTLTVFTIVYLTGMSIASTLARRFGVKRVVIAAALLGCPPLARALTANEAAALVAGLVVYGFFAGVLDAGMNAQGVALERELKRPIMARLHGGASAGGAVGAILGSLIVTGSTPWVAALMETCALALAAVAIALAAPKGRERVPSGGHKLDTRVLTRAVIVIGAVVGVSIACETAALAWSAPLLSGEAPKLAALAGLGGAFFSACQSALRLNADWLRARLDDRTIIALSLGLAACGLLIVALPLGFAVSAFGFAIVGFGTAAIVPCGFALAGTRPGVSPAASISAVAFFGLFARVPAPVITGVIADEVSLSAAFVALAALLIVALAAVLAFVPATSSHSRGSSS